MGQLHVSACDLIRKLSAPFSITHIARCMLVVMVLSIITPYEVAADIYLVRHAEKQHGVDPGLTDCGRQRAQWLEKYFSSLPVTAVFTTPFVRTRETAGPVAQYHNLALQEYNPRNLVDFARSLVAHDGDVLVVGHSNTTPQLVRLLTSDSVEDLDEDQYDRLYRISDEGEWHLEIQSFACTYRMDSNHWPRPPEGLASVCLS